MIARRATALACWLAFTGNAALAQSGSYKVVYAFTGGANGSKPTASLVNVAGRLYGTTQAGGSSSGTVFSLDPTTGTAQVYPLPYNLGVFPDAALFDFRGTLYGTADQGGVGGKCRGGCGTVFTVNPTSGAQQLLYSFLNIDHGIYPTAGLINIGGTLYGTTSYGADTAGCPHARRGGAAGCGTVFSLNPGKGTVKTLYAFQNGSDGAHPGASLVNVNGTLYGTTASGGPSNFGTIFSLDPVTGAEHVLYAFQNDGDGVTPEGGLINVGGILYGTASEGVLGCNCGTVFSLNPATGVFKVVYAFKGNPDASAPFAGLIAVGQKLYRTTLSGGTGNSEYGTLFSVDTATGNEVVLHSFSGNTDGIFPEAALINVGGTLFGTTNGGGGSQNCFEEYSYGCGTVFAYTP